MEEWRRESRSGPQLVLLILLTCFLTEPERSQLYRNDTNMKAVLKIPSFCIFEHSFPFCFMMKF